MRTPKISIIIPVYNTERYLRQCLDSVIAQSYKDWELILVDDGSTDESGDICDAYVLVDNRIKVYHKDNGGVSSARNYGLRKAQGEWLYFCDSDDELCINALDVLVSGASNQVDLVNAGYKIIGIDGKIQSVVPQRESELISVEQMLQRLVYSDEYNYQGYLVTKLFRNDIITKNELFFNTGIYYNEDRLFIAQYLCKCTGTVYFSTESIYKYFYRTESATQSLGERDADKLATSIAANILILAEIHKSKCSNETIKLWDFSAIRSFYQTHNKFILYRKDLDRVEQLKLNLIKKTGFNAFVVYWLKTAYCKLKTIAHNVLIKY